MNLQEQIVNLQTGEITWRDYTAEEIAVHNAKKEQNKLKVEEASEKANARKAIFDKLGLTEEEAKLLLS